MHVVHSRDRNSITLGVKDNSPAGADDRVLIFPVVEQVSRREIPQFDCPVVSTGCSQLSIGRNGDAANEFRMAGERADPGPVVDVPEPHGSSFSGGQYASAV
jgi:hypothetical protein